VLLYMRRSKWSLCDDDEGGSPSNALFIHFRTTYICYIQFMKDIYMDDTCISS
jgi:hypothetical protein